MALLLVGSAAGACGGSPTADDFAQVGGDTGPKPKLSSSVFWFLINRTVPEEGASSVDAVFLSPRCKEAVLPKVDDNAMLGEDRTEVVDGDRGVVSYDIKVMDYEAYRDDSNATEIPTKEIVEIRDENWLRVNGLWLWDDC